jgi:hypothetical protein
MFTRIFLTLTVLVAATQFALADSPSVTAVLSNSEMEVGETVQLEIRVTGGRNAEVPEQIAVDGLEIQRTGTSQQFEMNNFSVTSSVTYNYTVLATKSGTFKIPSQTIRLEGKTLRTPELKLQVVDSSGGVNARANPNPSRAIQTRSAKGLAFAELIVPKKSAYVGEMVPVQVRLGFEPRSQPQLLSEPEIISQGFTSQKLQQAGQRFETINGKTYNVVSFKTAIAAARSGKFEIGPVRVKAQISVPRRPSSRPQQRSPFDLFDYGDPFNDPFFSNPFGQFAERREIEVKSEPVSFEVKPLPPNSPPGFSGAVGSFTMTTDAKPKTVQVGDPITVTSTVTGRGNFDRVSAPALENESGWHKYPPSSKFTQDDDVGISGSKSFETVISPNEKKHDLPSLVFSYFDPVKENYVTLRSDTIPIVVEGGASSTPNVALAQPGSPPPATTKPTPQEKPADILYQLSERGRVVHSFAPIYTQPIFWTAQLIPLLGLIGLGGWKIREAKISNREAQRIAGLQHEADKLMRKLRRDDTPREYFADASRAVRVKAALAKHVDPNSVDLNTVADAFRLDDDARERFRRLFERSDELQYSGRSLGAATVSREDRRETLELIESLRA